MTIAKERVQIALSDATFKQLKAFAEEDMGIQVPNGTNGPQLQEKLKEAGWDKDYILGGEKPPAPVAAPAAKPADGAPMQVEEPMFEIELGETAGAGGKRPYFVGVNGVGVLLPRNKRIEVKRRYVEALRSAKEQREEMDEETNKMEMRTIFAVPFQIHESPSKADVAAWLAWESYQDAQDRAAHKKQEAQIRARLAAEAGA